MLTVVVKSSTAGGPAAADAGEPPTTDSAHMIATAAVVTMVRLTEPMTVPPIGMGSANGCAAYPFDPENGVTEEAGCTP